MTKHFFTQILVLVGLLTIFFTAAAFVVPWDKVSWGRLEMVPASTVTVSGSAENQERSQIARFTAGVDATNEDKQAAIDEVNAAMEQVITAVKEFGIPEEDIKTQSVSVHRMEEPRILNAPDTTGEDEWRASNTIEIVLREVDRASEITDLLSSTPATNVYGPNFAFEDVSATQKDLLGEAIKDAEEKALKIAESSGRTLGRVISVSEAGGGGPVYPMMALEGRGGGGAPIEPGTGTVSQSVTVTFELR